MSSMPPKDVPLVPGIWPLGWNMVLSAAALGGQFGVLEFKALPDGFTELDDVTEDEKEKMWDLTTKAGAPTLRLVFKDADTVRDHILTCHKLLEAMAAREGEA